MRDANGSNEIQRSDREEEHEKWSPVSRPIVGPEAVIRLKAIDHNFKYYKALLMVIKLEIYFGLESVSPQTA